MSLNQFNGWACENYEVLYKSSSLETYRLWITVEGRGRAVAEQRLSS